MATKTKGAKKGAKKAAKTTKAAPRASTNEKANGETQPREGGKTRRVWDIADKLAAKKGGPDKVTRAEVLAQAVEKEGASLGMASTQYGRWRRFRGLSGRTPSEGGTKKAAAKKATKATKGAKKAARKAPAKAAAARKRAPKAPSAAPAQETEGGEEE